MAYKANAAEGDRGAGRELEGACEASPSSPAGAQNSRHIRFDIAELERIADWREQLGDKIERGLWCLNLHLLDGFSRAELVRLQGEVSRFTLACLEARPRP